MAQKKCPNCDGKLTIPKQSSTIVCEYCNTTVNVRTGEILKENYFMKLQYDLEMAAEKMYSWGMKQLGAPKGLDQSKIVESKLVFWPFWVVKRLQPGLTGLSGMRSTGIFSPAIRIRIALAGI